MPLPPLCFDLPDFSAPVRDSTRSRRARSFHQSIAKSNVLAGSDTPQNPASVQKVSAGSFAKPPRQTWCNTRSCGASGLPAGNGVRIMQKDHVLPEKKGGSLSVARRPPAREYCQTGLASALTWRSLNVGFAVSGTPPAHTERKENACSCGAWCPTTGSPGISSSTTQTSR